jgi:hypothetical protein
MKIDIPDKSLWSAHADQIEDKITKGADEPAMLEYFAEHPWILLVMFAHHYEGVCFREYELCDEERPDFLLVHGRSFPDATMIEFKTPQAKMFTQRGTMSAELNEAVTSTLNRMFMTEIDYDHHFNRLSKQVEELWTNTRRPYHGVYHGPLTTNFTVPFEKHVKFWSKIIIGRDSGLTRDSHFREGVGRFLGRIELLTYDSILRTLRKYVPDENA